MECMLQVFSMTAHVAALRQDHRKYAAKYPRDRGNRGVMGDCCRVVDARHCFQVVMSLLPRLIAGATTLITPAHKKRYTLAFCSYTAKMFVGMNKTFVSRGIRFLSTYFQCSVG